MVHQVCYSPSAPILTSSLDSPAIVECYNPRRIVMDLPRDPGADADRTLTFGVDADDLGPSLSRWRHLEIREVAGSGGFGSVYRAWDPVLERDVALKLLRVRDPAGVIAEGRALARVRHPNVATVYGVETHDGVVGLWTEFIKGRTLADQLRLHGPLGAREAALIVQDVCRALAAVHAAGLLHRDIKVHNVMREEGGRIVLMDFGLSEVLRAHPAQPAATSGTPPYMAPELLRLGAASVQSDIYATGVMLYHLVTGQYPVEGRTLRAIAAQLAEGLVVQLRDRRPDLPEPFLRSVEKATALDAESRYTSAGELGKALAGAIDGSQPSPTQSRRHVPMWAIAAMLGLALCATGAIAWRQFLPMAGTAAPAGGKAYASYRTGRQLLERHDRDSNIGAAIEAFQSTVQADPRFALAYAGLGDAYWEKYRSKPEKRWLDLAEKNSQRALELNNQIGSVYATLGRIHADAGQNDLAMQEFQRGFALDPRNADLYRGLAQCYESMGRLDEAETALKKAAALRPDYWYGYNRLGSFYYRRGRYADAVLQYRRVVELTPDNTQGLNNLGTTLMAMGRWDEAGAALGRARAIQPTVSNLTNLGSIALLQGRYADGAASLEKALRLDDTNYKTWGNAAAAYAWAPGGKAGGKANAKKYYTEAVLRAEQARKLRPSDPKLLADLASFNAMLDRRDESLSLVDQVIALAPEDPDVFYRLGEAYEHLGRREEAVRWIRRAVDKGYSTRYLRANPEFKKLLEDPRLRDVTKQ